MLALLVAFLGVLVPATYPERISFEMDECLCLDGMWEGICRGWPGMEKRDLKLRIEKGFFCVSEPGKLGDIVCYRSDWIDEGRGKFRARDPLAGNTMFRGNYKREGGFLILCFRFPKNKLRTEEPPVLFFIKPVRGEKK